MTKRLIGLSIFGIVLALVLAMGYQNVALAGGGYSGGGSEGNSYLGGYRDMGRDTYQSGPDVRRDQTGRAQYGDANQFGTDDAYNSVYGGDRDMGPYTTQFETYGLHGDYWYYMK